MIDWYELAKYTLIGGLLGGLCGLYPAYIKRRDCPNCGTSFPGIKGKTTWKQRLWEGYTCPQCGLEFDGKHQTS